MNYIFNPLSTCNLLYLFLVLTVTTPQHLFAGEVVGKEIEQIVFKLLIDDKPITYITGSYNEDGCYVRIFEVLDQLGYKYNADWGAHSFAGYLPEGKGYTILENNIMPFEKEEIVSNQIQWTAEHDLFVSIGFLEEFYDLKIQLSIAELVIKIQSSETAPYRKNHIKSRRISDFLEQKEKTTLKNIDTLALGIFKVNALGYGAITSFNYNDQLTSNWGARGTLNGELLRGSYYLEYNYSESRTGSTWTNNPRFNWAKTNPNNKLIKTIMIDHDFPPILTPTLGYASSITFSNTKQKSYLDRTYTYEGRTQPYSEVEIYNNGQLIDYAVSDSLGGFSVEVPVTGVENKITAISYNSYGVPVSTEKMVYMPAGLLRGGQLIYKLSAGITDHNEYFIAPTLEFGLTSWWTLMAGNETLIRDQEKTSVSIFGSKFSFFRKLRLDLRCMQNIMYSARIYGSIIPSTGINVYYEKFNLNQKIMKIQTEENLAVSLNGVFPKFIKGNYNMGLNYSRFIYGEMLSTYIGFNVWKNNFIGSFYVNTNEQKIDIKYPAYTLRLGYYFSNKLFNEIGGQYLSYQKNYMLQNRTNLQFKNKLTLFTDASYFVEQKQYNLSLGIIWQLPFVRNRSGMVTTGINTTAYTDISGSIRLNNLKNISFSDRYASGASLLVILFVDINANGKYDRGEPIIKKPKMVIRVPAIENRTTEGVLYTDIPPNVPFKLIVPQQKFEDISWQLSDYDRNLLLSNYQSKTIYVPVSVLTEISGEITVKKGIKTGVANMAVVITNIRTGDKSVTYTDSWGTFVYMGLTCGDYIVDLHSGYLKQMKLKKSNPEYKHKLTINPMEEGKQIDGFNFELIPDT